MMMMKGRSLKITNMAEKRGGEREREREREGQRKRQGEITSCCGEVHRDRTKCMNQHKHYFMLAETKMRPHVFS